MNEVDRDALERALVACRAESAARAKQLDSKLRDEPWEEVAQFASYCAQGRALDLMPWQSPPCRANLARLERALWRSARRPRKRRAVATPARCRSVAVRTGSARRD